MRGRKNGGSRRRYCFGGPVRGRGLVGGQREVMGTYEGEDVVEGWRGAGCEWDGGRRGEDLLWRCGGVRAGHGKEGCGEGEDGRA